MQNTETMKETVFTVDKVDPVALYGINDQNLRVIEKNYPIQFIARGDQLKIRGKAEDVDQVENVLSEMVFTLNRNKRLTQEDVETIVHVVQADYLSHPHDAGGEMLHGARELDDVVLFTKNGYIKARTVGQQQIAAAIRQNDLVVIIGPAGTGKTYMAVALAVAALKEKRVKKIVLARPAVEAGESLGFLPGDYKEKIDPYLRPLYDALEAMLPRNMIRKYTEQGIIEVIPLAFMRGRTLNNSFVILDEAQNATSMQMKMFLTRLGINSKAIVNGDITQIDLPDRRNSGLMEIKEVLFGIDGIEFIFIHRNDVVRHRLVRDILKAYDSFENPDGDSEEIIARHPQKGDNNDIET